MGTISIICASPPGPNPGMASVDLAFFKLARQNFSAHNVQFFHLYTSHEAHSDLPQDELEAILRRQALPLEHRCMRDQLDAIYSSNAILFWGDFLHSRQYLHELRKKLVNIGVASTEREAERVVYQHLYLSDAPRQVLKRCILYGGSLIFDTEDDYLDGEYKRNVSRLMSESHRVLMRDVFSAFKADYLTGDYLNSHLGTDCALLLSAPLSTETATDTSDGTQPFAAVFFGRSGRAELLSEFAAELCAELDLECRLLPWGHAKAFPGPEVTVNWPQVPVKGAAENRHTIIDLLEGIRQAKLVISDTYHVCVNSWRLGVPAICIGEAVPREPWTVSCGITCQWRDKRQAFYSMYDAMAYYVVAEELSELTLRRRRKDHLTAVYFRPDLTSAIAARIKDHSESAKTTLVSAISTLMS